MSNEIRLTFVFKPGMDGNEMWRANVENLVELADMLADSEFKHEADFAGWRVETTDTFEVMDYELGSGFAGEDLETFPYVEATGDQPSHPEQDIQSSSQELQHQ